VGKLDGKVALITGAGGGQGLAAARLFAKEGARVVVSEFNRDTGAAAADEIRAAGGQAVFAQCDVADEQQVKAATDLAISSFGRLDILYNNAGMYFASGGNYRPGFTDGPSPFLEDNIWERTIAVNLKSVYLGCKYAIPQMRKLDAGSIINVSTVGAIRVGRGTQSDAYTAAKGGVLSMTRTLAIEHAQYQIRCNCIFPGAIKSGFGGPGPRTPEYLEAVAKAIPLGRWGEPEDVAKMALFLASDDSSWITGQFFVVDGGFTAA
jgi:NAD(P)-dependent dehydrogenase (short-subunit alcohol dehydrogenase family)